MERTLFDELLAAGYNRIPLVRELLADLETPLSVYLKLAKNQAYSYLFESVQGGEQWGRYSIIGLACRETIRVQGKTITHQRDGQIIGQITADDPLTVIEKLRRQYRIPELPYLPRFHGGLVGYFGYDTIRYIEPRLQQTKKIDPLQAADILLMLSEELVVFDNLSGTLQLIVYAGPKTYDYSEAQTRLDNLTRLLKRPVDLTTEPTRFDNRKIQYEFSEAAFKAAVLQAKEHIAAGDIMQVVLSQRSQAPFFGDSLNLYRALRHLNPSPYMYFLNLAELQLVGSSPEILVRLEQDKITVRPIAGTRPRGETPEQDQALEKELLSDPKELAEHLMLIDLGRNDIGRVSQTGSVKLSETMSIERYSHVMHIVSNVTGKLADNLSPMDVLRATFPAGTLSGAPKVRAMEIIDQLEPVKRGIYGGAIGYIGWDGNIDTAIAIRTAVIKNNTLYMQAGAGIVNDSIPEAEWQETLNKSQAIFRAAIMASELSEPIE